MTGGGAGTQNWPGPTRRRTGAAQPASGRVNSSYGNRQRAEGGKGGGTQDGGDREGGRQVWRWRPPRRDAHSPPPASSTRSRPTAVRAYRTTAPPHTPATPPPPRSPRPSASSTLPLPGANRRQDPLPPPPSPPPRRPPPAAPATPTAHLTTQRPLQRRRWARARGPATDARRRGRRRGTGGGGREGMQRPRW